MSESESEHGFTTVSDPIRVLCVDDDPDYLALLETTLDDQSDIHTIVETDAGAALHRIDEVDCVVSDFRLPDTDGLDFLELVRRRRPRIPFVVHTSVAFEEVAPDLFDEPCTDYVNKAWDAAQTALLAHRIRVLVERCRYWDAANRHRAAVDTSREPTLIVGSDDEVVYANHRLSSEFPTDRRDIVGRSWTGLFTDESAERLRVEAVPIAAEGWNWTGESVLQTRSGVSMRARTSLVQLDDGSKVFVFHGIDRTGDVSE